MPRRISHGHVKLIELNRVSNIANLNSQTYDSRQVCNKNQELSELSYAILSYRWGKNNPCKDFAWKPLKTYVTHTN